VIAMVLLKNFVDALSLSILVFLALITFFSLGPGKLILVSFISPIGFLVLATFIFIEFSKFRKTKAAS